MKLSIIVPLYNNEQYIGRCLDSIIRMNQIDWECIVVDDGSDDGSGKVADDYAVSDNRIKCIHTLNGGVSKARNIGIKEATGNALLFLDSDDWLMEKAEEYIKEALIKIKNGTITVFGHVKVREDGSRNIRPMPDLTGLNYNEIIRELTVKSQRLNNCWGIILEKSVIDENRIAFDTNMKVAEDACFIFEYLKHCHAICASSNILIAYWDNGNGAMHRTGIETIRDDEKCFIKRKEMLHSLNINLSDEEYGLMCNFYFSNVVGYIASECNNHKAQEACSIIKSHVRSDYVSELMKHIDKNKFTKSKQLLYVAIKLRAYWLCYLMMSLFARKQKN